MKHIIFVYNADSGLFNTLTDFAHKMISPKTYACNLCAITHPIRMSDEWKAFIESLAHKIEFLHRDEFSSQYGEIDTALPAVFERHGDNLKTPISAEEINHCNSITDLKNLVSEHI